MATYDLKSSTPPGIVTGDILNCSYSGTYKSITLPPGTYKLECWGAEGGSYQSSKPGGKGGKAEGTLTTTEEKTFYLYVGGMGKSIANSASGGSGGFNGGGAGGAGSSSSYGFGGSGGGGASDIRLGSTGTSARIIVAGGGGGAGGPGCAGSSSLSASTSAPGGAAGVAGSSSTQTSYGGKGGGAATASSGGTGGAVTTASTSSSDATYYAGGGGGGGGGYYGGGGGGGGSLTTTSQRGSSGKSGSSATGGAGGASYPYGETAYYGSGGGGGGGGSSWVSSTLTSTATYLGSASFTGTSGSSETGHASNGYIRITVIEVVTGLNIPFYAKVNNAWVKASNAFTKVNGVWYPISMIKTKVGSAWALCKNAAAWILGAPVKTSTQTGQTASISGSKTYNFNEDTGELSLGSTSTYSLSSLYSSKEPVYTSVSGKVLTYKIVTDSKTSTSSAYYSEGSPSSSSTTSTSDGSVSGYTSYNFSSSTGNYSSSGSSTSHSYSSMYNNETTVYTGFGSTLTYKRVTDKDTSTSTTTSYSEGSISWDSWQEEQEWSGGAGISISGYTSYGFSSSGGYYTSGLYQTTPTYYEGDSADITLYDVSSDGKTLYVTQLQASNYYCRARTGSATASTSSTTTTTTTYTITTYTQGSTYHSGGTTTTYTVETYTRTATENGGNTDGTWSYGSPQYISSYTKTSGSLSGYSTMPEFDPDTGWFTAVGSKGSYSLGTLGSSWVYTTVYNASDINYVEMEKIIDTSQTTSYTDGSWSYVSYEQDTEAVGFYGYGYASVDPDTGEWIGEAYNHYVVMEGDYGSTTFYQISGNTCYQITLEGDGKEVWMTTYKATSVARTTTTYTIGTYRIYAVEN